MVQEISVKRHPLDIIHLDFSDHFCHLPTGSVQQEHCVTFVDDQARLTLCWILLDVLSSLSSFEPLVRSGMDMDTFPNCPKILVPPHAPAHSDWGNLDTDPNNEGKGPA